MYGARVPQGRPGPCRSAQGRLGRPPDGSAMEEPLRPPSTKTVKREACVELKLGVGLVSRCDLRCDHNFVKAQRIHMFRGWIIEKTYRAGDAGGPAAAGSK